MWCKITNSRIWEYSSQPSEHSVFTGRSMWACTTQQKLVTVFSQVLGSCHIVSKTVYNTQFFIILETWDFQGFLMVTWPSMVQFVITWIIIQPDFWNWMQLSLTRWIVCTLCAETISSKADSFFDSSFSVKSTFRFCFLIWQHSYIPCVCVYLGNGVLSSNTPFKNLITWGQEPTAVCVTAEIALRAVLIAL